MPNDIKQQLTSFLESSEPPVKEVAVVTAPPIVGPGVVVVVPEKEKAKEIMKALLASIKMVEMTAKDLHYRAHGKAFYGLHLLADLIWQMGSLTDKIIEVYFMGECEMADPPQMSEIYALAIATPQIGSDDAGNYIHRLKIACKTAMKLVEEIKATTVDLKSGTIAVLDEVSQQCLIAIGLLAKSED